MHHALMSATCRFPARCTERHAQNLHENARALFQPDPHNPIVQSLPFVHALPAGHLHGFDAARFDHHLHLIFGARQQFYSPGLSKPRAVRFKEHRAVIGLDL